jgi:hypothetical protein
MSANKLPAADAVALCAKQREVCSGKGLRQAAFARQAAGSADGATVIQFNKIVLNACRADMAQRYQSAEDLMTALLTFQFSKPRLRKFKVLDHYSGIISIGGMMIGFGYVIALLWRLIWVLKHTP